MVQVIYHEDNKIEIGISDKLTQDQFSQIIHQLESLAASHSDINVLLDATDISKYDFKIILDEYDFYKKYKNSLNRVALVSNRKLESFFVDQFSKFSDVDIKAFEPGKIEDARNWIFPSKLP